MAAPSPRRGCRARHIIQYTVISVNYTIPTYKYINTYTNKQHISLSLSLSIYIYIYIYTYIGMSEDATRLAVEPAGQV